MALAKSLAKIVVWFEPLLPIRMKPTGSDSLPRRTPFDSKTLSSQQFMQLFHDSQRDYNGMFGTGGRDFQWFRKANKKIITWHGVFGLRCDVQARTGRIEPSRTHSLLKVSPLRVRKAPG